MLRWHQTADYGYAPNKDMPNTSMAVALDLPDDDSPYRAIHPRDKQDVGKRLSMASMHYIYGLNFSASGPVIQSVVQSDQGHVTVNYPMGEELVVEERKNFEVSDAVNLAKFVSLSLLFQWSYLSSKAKKVNSFDSHDLAGSLFTIQACLSLR